MNIKIRHANIDDYQAVEVIMRQVQQMHIDWRPDIYRHSDAVLPTEVYEQAVHNETAYVAVCEGQVTGDRNPATPIPPHRMHKPGDKRCDLH